MKRLFAGLRAVFRLVGAAGRATIALVGICGVGVALANYAMTQGSGTNFGSIIVSTVHYAQQLLCDPTTPSQCVGVNASGQTTIANSSFASTQSGVWNMRNFGNTGAALDFAGQNAASPPNAFLMGGQFNTTPTTITSGNASPFQVDANGNLQVNVKAGGAGGGIVTVNSGGVASGAYSAGAFAAGALAASSAVDGWDVTQGSKSDTACATSSSTCSISSLLHGILGGVLNGAGTIGVAVPSTAIYMAMNVAGSLTGLPGSAIGLKNDLSGINGTATATGNGTSGAGNQRINIASDNSAVSGFGVGAIGSPPPANAPYESANVAGNLTGSIKCGSSVIYDASTSGETQIVALSGLNSIYVCGYSILSAGTVNVNLATGTGTACATGTTKLTPAYQLTAQVGIVDNANEYRGLKTSSGGALCINTSAAVAVQAIVYYTQF